MLARGEWKGRQDVSAEWIKRVTTPAVTIDGDFKYGYHWNVGTRPDGAPSDPPRFIAGIGWGGQRLHVVPGREVIVVIHCGNCGRSNRERRGVINSVLTEVVQPSFVSRI